MLKLSNSVGCQFYRTESRGLSWDSDGNHVQNASYGFPFALVQGTLQAVGIIIKNIPTEFCPTIRRGSVAWIGSGPEFFISLANNDWKWAYTVFGYVPPEVTGAGEKIAQLPIRWELWGNINVGCLGKTYSPAA